jgi:hypothetical protein
LKAGLVRFALPELPCVRMAHERAHAGTPLERFVAA